MQKGFRMFSVSLAVVLAVYFTWAGWGRKRPPVDVHLHLDTVYAMNADAGKGNAVGISPYMTPLDYASPQHFLNKLDGYMQAAQQRGWLTPRTVVVFPEYVGSWLVAEGEKSAMFEAQTIGKAMAVFIGSNFFSYLRDWFTAPDEAEDKVLHSIFSSKGVPMARTYRQVFGDLARKYKVGIVAGSILLPNPVLDNGRIRIRMGPLYNLSAVFNPDGSIHPRLVRKSHPVAEEQPFVASGDAGDIPVFDLAAGRTAIMICADAWFPESHQTLKGATVDLVAVPSYTQGEGSMQGPWKGYSGYPMPPDVDSTDRGRLTLQEAWLKYAMPGRMRQTSVRNALMVSLRGRLWDQGSDGVCVGWAGDSLYVEPERKGASVVNLYLR
jgi:predicted amidohydrolase